MPVDLTVTCRQSCPGMLSPQRNMNALSSMARLPRGALGATVPKDMELRRPAHGAGLEGGRKRAPPSVVAAYGIPLNVWIPFLVKPRTFPAVVSTTALPSRATIRGPLDAMAELFAEEQPVSSRA